MACSTKGCSKQNDSPAAIECLGCEEGRRLPTRGRSMAGRQQVDTKEFRALSFAEQAKSITATIHNLQAAIEHHVEHSPRRPETIQTCLAQVDRLRHRLRKAYEQQGTHSGPGQAVPRLEEVARVHMRSPRLAEPERAADFTMDVAEETPDAGLQ
jgi:hypothetical protein